MADSEARGTIVDAAREASFDPDSLRGAFDLLNDWIDQGALPGAAALIARGGRIAGEAYLGLSHRSRGQSVTSATIWSLASITKPFTAAAAMLMVERGAFSLDEPLHGLLPEFSRVPVSAFDRHQVTLRQVLGHCSGLPGFSEDNVELRKAHRPLEDFVRSFGRQPLLFAPGAAHCYSNCGILLAAETVARALDGTLGVDVDRPAIRRFHPFVHEQILAPLGMTSSSLLPPADWDARIAWVERTGQEGQDWEGANSAYYRSLGIPWGGMFSRPRDLVRFVDLFLPTAAGRQRVGSPLGVDGESAGEIVSPATARAMTTVQFAPPGAPPDLAPDQREDVRVPPLRSVEWGIGWEIKGTKRAHRSGELTSPATYSHAGATGTMVWADPETDVVCVLLTNRTLASGWTTERPRQALFSNAVMAALR